MKKLNKISLISSLCLLSVGLITPIAVSCSSNSPNVYIPEPEVFTEVDSGSIQKATYNSKELNRDQYNFKFEICCQPHKKFNIIGYDWDHLNYYDSKYDNSNAPNENSSTIKSNVLLIPSKIMYQNEWYSLNRIVINGRSYKNNSLFATKLKSIRLDPSIDYELEHITLNLSLINDEPSSLVDIENLPIICARKYPDGTEYFYTVFNINLQNCKSFSSVTFNENIKPKYQGVKGFTLPRLAWKQTEFDHYRIPLKNFRCPSKVNTIYNGTFHFIEYNPEILWIPSWIEYIGGFAFNETFRSSIIPKRFYINEIKDGLFFKMTIDTEIPNSVQTIGEFAFAGSKPLKKFLKIPEGVTYIKNSAFRCDPLNHSSVWSTYYLPDSLEQIGTKQQEKRSKEYGFPFEYDGKTFVVKSERVKNLLIQSAKTYGITDFTDRVRNIIVDPNWDKNI